MSLSLVGSIKNPTRSSPPLPPKITINSYVWEMKNFSSSDIFVRDPKNHQPNIIGASEEIRQGRGEKSPGKEQEADVEEKARCEWDFNLTTLISSSKFADVSDTLGVVEFDPSDTLLATGGIARKIRVYTIRALLPSDDDHQSESVALLDHANACDSCICTPAKLSSLRWKPGTGGRVLGSGDYDGVVMEYDLEKKLPIFERDEHGGRRVWSMDYSHQDPVMGASGSDDGTMQMWDPRCDVGKTVAAVQPSARRSSICCVEFNPFGGAIVAAGSADRRVYLYDTRKMVDPLMVFDGHQKAVTYVRFLDHNTIVTSSIDGCLKMWHTQEQSLIRTYKGHVNAKRFVGLSVWRNGGLLSCGSESNQVFVYDKRWGAPIWVYRFEPVAGRAGLGLRLDCGSTVSSVCWRQTGDDQCTLVAGGSDGVLQVFRGKRRS